MANTKDENGLDKFDEAKLKRELEKNKDFLRSNKDVFAEKEPRILTCTRYNPCPMCEKCKNKASHLYIKCQKCAVPICVHTSETINKMIKRKNFIQMPKDTDIVSSIKKLGSMQ